MTHLSTKETLWQAKMPFGESRVAGRSLLGQSCSLQVPGWTRMIDLSIVIVNWNAKELLRRCLESMYEGTRGIAFEVLVVDNASRDGSPQMVRHSFPQVRFIGNEENAGFARACNQGLRRARGRYIVLLNPDTWLPDDALGQMVAFLDEHPNIGVLGPRIVDPDGIVDPRCARRYPSLRSELFEKLRLDRRFPRSRLFGDYLMTYWDHKDSREVDALSGACMMIRPEVVEGVGLLDEDFFIYGEDVEYCYRIKKTGWQVLFYAKSTVVHLGAQSSRLVAGRMGIEALQSMYLFFLKTRGPRYAAAYRVLILGLSIAKQFVFLVGSLVCRSGEARSHCRRKIQLHKSVLKWAWTGS